MYWDTDTSGFAAGDGVGNGADPAGMTGKTTVQMKQAATFTGWDFVMPIWEIIENSLYPYLDFQTIPNAPTNVIATRGNGSATITFVAPVNNGGSPLTDYIIEYKLTTEPTVWTTFTDGVSTNLTTTVTGLTNGLSYDFRVSTLNTFGQ